MDEKNRPIRIQLRLNQAESEALARLVTLTGKCASDIFRSVLRQPPTK
jgi:hypothetical protein